VAWGDITTHGIAYASRAIATRSRPTGSLRRVIFEDAREHPRVNSGHVGSRAPACAKPCGPPALSPGLRQCRIDVCENAPTRHCSDNTASRRRSSDAA
jgi:hypothetical protein